eukprot:26167_1
MSKGQLNIKSGTVTTGMVLLSFLCIGIVMQYAFIANTHLMELNTNKVTMNQNGVMHTINLSSSEWFCLSHASDNRTCTLSPNVTITFNKRIGRGFKSQIWSVNSGTPKRVMVMKYSINKPKWYICDDRAMIEYETMDALYKYNNSLSTAQLIYEPQLHYYQYIYPQNDTIAGCVFFMTQFNAIGILGDLRNIFDEKQNANQLQTEWKIHHHFLSIDPLQFIMNCYLDILSVLNAVNAIGKYYNDLHFRQILVEEGTHRCYLIDF